MVELQGRNRRMAMLWGAGYAGSEKKGIRRGMSDLGGSALNCKANGVHV